MKFNSLRKFFAADSGIAAIEIALILPFMLFMFFGLVDITDMVSYNRRITSVASAVADLTGQNRTNVLKTDVEDYFKAATLIMSPKSDSTVRVTVSGYRKSGTTISKEWVIDNGKGIACVAPSTTTMADLMAAGNDIIVSQACMQYTPMVSELLGKSILGASLFTIQQNITLRPRSSLKLDCYTTASLATACPKS
jgi:Flp pilus assembly protein TadG